MPSPTKSVRRVILDARNGREYGPGKDKPQREKAEHAVGVYGVLDDDEGPTPHGGDADEQECIDQSHNR